LITVYNTGKSGIIEYLEKGEKSDRVNEDGEVITRDMLDERLTIDGDIRSTQYILQNMKDRHQNYYHITSSFYEDDISIEELKEIVQKQKEFYSYGMNVLELNFYTEIHIPKDDAKYQYKELRDGKEIVKLMSEDEAKEFKEKNPHLAGHIEKRKIHFHTVIPKENLLTKTEFKLTEDGRYDKKTGRWNSQDIKYLDALQERINIEYGLSSPNDEEHQKGLTRAEYKKMQLDKKENVFNQTKWESMTTFQIENLTGIEVKKALSNHVNALIKRGDILSYDDLIENLKNNESIVSVEYKKRKSGEVTIIKLKGHINSKNNQLTNYNFKALGFKKSDYENLEVDYSLEGRTIKGKNFKDYTILQEEGLKKFKEQRNKRYDFARENALKIDLIEKALKDKFELRTITNTNEENIISDLNQGKAVFLTGGAGVGKSFTTNNIIKHFENRGLTVAKLGSTGIASTNINGQTLHSFLEIGIKKDIKALQQFDKNNQERINKLNEKLKNTDLIVIDEISMVSDKQMEMINYRLKNANYQGKLMVVGDFNQLPPVSKDEKVGYAFESKAWKDLKTQTHELTVIKRSDNKEFSQTLNRLRYGYISKEDNQMFLNMQNNKIDESKATYIYSTNKAVQNHNKQKLDALKGKYESYDTSFKSEHNLTDVQKDKLLDETPLYKNLEIKKNTPILITANDKNLGVANGDRGVYLGLNENNQMIIKLDRTNKVINIDKKEFNIEIEQDDKLINATIKNYPIRPAYAITTHKSQGMSIDHLAIDPNRQFEKNQFYVAVSRAKDPSKLKILPLDKKYKNNFQNVVKQDNKVLDFYHPTLRSKELKQFDKEVSKRQDLKKEIYFKNLKMKKEQIKEKVIKRSNSSVLKKPRVSIFAKNKQLRQLKKYTRNKVQELRANFKKMKEKYNPIEKLNKIVKYQQEEKNTNKKQAEQNIKQKQLQKTKG